MINHIKEKNKSCYSFLKSSNYSLIKNFHLVDRNKTIEKENKKLLYNNKRLYNCLVKIKKGRYKTNLPHNKSIDLQKKNLEFGLKRKRFNYLKKLNIDNFEIGKRIKLIKSSIKK